MKYITIHQSFKPRFVAFNLFFTYCRSWHNFNFELVDAIFRDFDLVPGEFENDKRLIRLNYGIALKLNHSNITDRSCQPSEGGLQVRLSTADTLSPSFLIYLLLKVSYRNYTRQIMQHPASFLILSILKIIIDIILIFLFDSKWNGNIVYMILIYYDLYMISIL